VIEPPSPPLPFTPAFPLPKTAFYLPLALAVWLRRPAWRAPGEGPAEEGDLRVRYDAPVPRGLRGYVTVNFAVIAAATFGLLLAKDAMSTREQVAVAAMILTGIAAWGALVEGKRWGVWLEVGRLGGTAALVMAWAAPRGFLIPGVVIAGAALIFGVWAIRLPRPPAPSATRAPSAVAARI
jgi:alkylglycerol monooxygenase